jgi:hypothetical protein
MIDLPLPFPQGISPPNRHFLFRKNTGNFQGIYFRSIFPVKKWENGGDFEMDAAPNKNIKKEF